MEKQFGIVSLRPGWRIVTLHGSGDVLERGVKIGDHSTLIEAIAKVNEYVLSLLAIWPEDTITIKIEAPGGSTSAGLIISRGNHETREILSLTG